MPWKSRTHRSQRPRTPENRPNATNRGYDHRWRKYRHWFLSQPENVLCCVEGCHQIATVVDHKVPHRGDSERFWDPDNHQPMCKRHHDQKTATEDGGFGHQAQAR